MNKQNADKIVAACETAGIKKYMYATDMPSYFYNDDKTAFVLRDNDGIHAFRRNGFSGAHGYFPTNLQICHNYADYEDVHEFRTAGTKEQMLAFIDALGLSVTDEQIEVLSWMDSVRNDIVPLTGDYTFKLLSDEEYEQLTPEEKEVYDKAKKQYDLEKAGISGKASISVSLG